MNEQLRATRFSSLFSSGLWGRQLSNQTGKRRNRKEKTKQEQTTKKGQHQSCNFGAFNRNLIRTVPKVQTNSQCPGCLFLSLAFFRGKDDDDDDDDQTDNVILKSVEKRNGTLSTMKIPERYTKNTRQEKTKFKELKSCRRRLRVIWMVLKRNRKERTATATICLHYKCVCWCQRGETETGRENFRPRAVPRVMLWVFCRTMKGETRWNIKRLKLNKCRMQYHAFFLIFCPSTKEWSTLTVKVIPWCVGYVVGRGDEEINTWRWLHDAAVTTLNAHTRNTQFLFLISKKEK